MDKNLRNCNGKGHLIRNSADTSPRIVLLVIRGATRNAGRRHYFNIDEVRLFSMVSKFVLVLLPRRD